MTDDLVKRLRDADTPLLKSGPFSETRKTLREAADRIEELEKANKEWAEVSQRNYQRAKAAEAKLAKAVEALEHAKLNMPHPDQMIDDTLAELKGETDAG